MSNYENYTRNFLRPSQRSGFHRNFRPVGAVIQRRLAHQLVLRSSGSILKEADARLAVNHRDEYAERALEHDGVGAVGILRDVVGYSITEAVV